MRTLQTLIICALLFGLVTNTTAQDQTGKQESIERPAPWIGASYGWLSVDGLRGGLFTAHLMLPRSEKRLLEFELLYFRNSYDKDITESDMVIGRAQVTNWRGEVRAKLGFVPVQAERPLPEEARLDNLGRLTKQFKGC